MEGAFPVDGRKGLEGKDPDTALIRENENLKAIIGEMTIANEILKKIT
ncbi:MAG: hypothetical protein M1317_02320 [Candidatus Thermoplasmatota archaeon]|nr:hypothetical protein [Candidatus Thermoplasmatota archaeon]